MHRENVFNGQYAHIDDPIFHTDKRCPVGSELLDSPNDVLVQGAAACEGRERCGDCYVPPVPPTFGKP